MGGVGARSPMGRGGRAAPQRTKGGGGVAGQGAGRRGRAGAQVSVGGREPVPGE